MQMPNYCGEFQPKYGDGNWSPTFRLTGSVTGSEVDCGWLRPCTPTDAKEAGPCESQCVPLASLESRCHLDCWDVEALCYHFQKGFAQLVRAFPFRIESINDSSLQEMVNGPFMDADISISDHSLYLLCSSSVTGRKGLLQLDGMVWARDLSILECMMCSRMLLNQVGTFQLTPLDPDVYILSESKAGASVRSESCNKCGVASSTRNRAATLVWRAKIHPDFVRLSRLHRLPWFLQFLRRLLVWCPMKLDHFSLSQTNHLASETKWPAKKVQRFSNKMSLDSSWRLISFAQHCDN